MSGSYISVVLIIGVKGKLPTNPPVTNTFPSGSSVAVWLLRSVLRLAVVLHVRVAGSYNSALLEWPPATSTFPLGKSVAVWFQRAVLRLRMANDVPEAGS